MSEQTSTPFHQLDAALDAAQESADTIASAIANNPDFTDEGRANVYARDTTDHRNFVQQLEERAQEFHAAAEARVEQARATVLPEPADDTAALTTEMQVQRILARPGMDDKTRVMQWIADTPASPTRTTVVNELVARGVIDADTVDAVLTSTHPEYAQAKGSVATVTSVYNNVYRPKFEALRRRLGNPTAQGREGYEGSVSVDVFGDDLPDVKVGRIPEWTPTRNESVYRSR